MKAFIKKYFFQNSIERRNMLDLLQEAILKEEIIYV